MTEDVAIRVEGLGKAYQISHKVNEGTHTYQRLSEDLVAWASWPWRKAKDLLNHQKIRKPAVEEFWALRNVSFEVKKGEVVGIIGRNGAGKSTLLKILSRITEPTEGRAEIEGRVASLLEVGTGFHPELTGRENIYLNGAILGMSRSEIRNKFDEIVNFAEIQKFLDTPVKRYSSGMYIRLAFSVAAHLDSDILLVDEVLAVGDIAFQKKCLGKIEDVAKSRRTVFFVSHNLTSIQRLCDWTILLNKGCIEINDATQHVIDYYLKNIEVNEIKNENIFNIDRKKGLGEKVKICDCKMIDLKGVEKYKYKYGEPLIIEAECVGLKETKNISWVVGVNTSYGDRIITSNSKDEGHVFQIREKQRLKTKMYWRDLMLTPGEYSLTIGIEGIDQIENVKRFEVTSISWDKKKYHNEKWGIIYLKPTWELSCESIP